MKRLRWLYACDAFLYSNFYAFQPKLQSPIMSSLAVTMHGCSSSQIFNTPCQSVLCVMLQSSIILVKVLCFLWPRPFVSRSAGCLFVGKYSNEILPSLTFSLRK